MPLSDQAKEYIASEQDCFGIEGGFKGRSPSYVFDRILHCCTPEWEWFTEELRNSREEAEQVFAAHLGYM